MWKLQCIYCTGILSVLTVSNTLDRVTFSSDKIANSPFGSSPVSWTSHTPAKSHQRQHVPEIRDYRLVPSLGGCLPDRTLKLVPYFNIINTLIFFTFKLTENCSFCFGDCLSHVFFL